MKNRIISIILAAAMLIVCISGCSQNTGSINITSTLAEAQRFLSEMKYEQAIIEFDKILEIDPKNIDAYLGKAEAYIAAGDTDNAVKALQAGYEATSDERIKAKLDILLAAASAETTTAETTTTVETTTTAQTTTTAETESFVVEYVTIAGETYSTDITELNLNEKNIRNEDIISLSKFKNLTYLNIWGNEFSDISPLSILTNLTKLWLWVNNISDISYPLNNPAPVKVGSNMLK